MTAEDGLLRCKTWCEETTRSEKSTEIIYVKNDIQYHYIRNGQRLSYRYIEKIIYGIWWLVGCQTVKSEENPRLVSVFWLAMITCYIEYKTRGRLAKDYEY